MTIKKICPVYINTLNIFRPLRTWLYSICHHFGDTRPRFPKVQIQLFNKSFDQMVENFYTWYWWEHPYIWNFEKKWAIFLFDDVQYKNKMGIIEMESCPFALIRIFNWNLLITLNRNNYQYWESLYRKR